jgi:hypothetical protein
LIKIFREEYSGFTGGIEIMLQNNLASGEPMNNNSNKHETAGDVALGV